MNNISDDVNDNVGSVSKSPSPIFINASASISALGRGAKNLTAFINAEKLERLPPPLHCYYQAIPLAPIEESYQRIYQLLSEVIEQVIAKKSLTSEELAKTSLFLGSSSMDIGAVRSDAERAIWLTKLDHLNLYLIKKYKLNNLHFVFSTACTSSANALIYATRLIRSDKVEQALVIGCEFYNQLTLKGFSSLALLSEQGLLAFSTNRDGMVLGEGVAALLLSKHVCDNSSLAMLEGYSSCDSYSLTTTEEDGSKISEVIDKSLHLSGLTAQEIQLVKAHGTASVASDRAEAKAINRVFSETVPSVVLKPFIGHTLGACGVLEVVLLDELIRRDLMPVPDYIQESQCGGNAKLDNLLNLVSPQCTFKKVKHILANHCGFGGNNAAFVLKNLKSETPLDLNETVKKDYSEKNNFSLQEIALSSVEYESSITNKELRKLVKQLTGFEVRRMDVFTLMALQAMYQLFEQAKVKALDLDSYQLGLYGVGDYFSVGLLQSLVQSIEQGEDVRPLDFISSVGNSANFYLAKQFNIRGVNLFTGACTDAQERTKELAKVDLALGIVDYTVVVHWQQNEINSYCSASLLALA